MSAYDDAIDRLRAVLPHLRLAASMAHIQAPGGTVGLAIVSKRADGSGAIGATFETEAFFSDLELITTEEPENELHQLNASQAFDDAVHMAHECREKIHNAETATREALDICENFPFCSSDCCPSCVRQRGSKLRKAYDEVRAELHGLLNAEPMLVDTAMDENGVRFSVQHWAVRLLGASMRNTLNGAKNYVQVELVDDRGQMLCTIQRSEGKSPHQLRMEAEDERDKAVAMCRRWGEDHEAEIRGLNEEIASLRAQLTRQDQ
jgi:hypothetical protein